MAGEDGAVSPTSQHPATMLGDRGAVSTAGGANSGRSSPHSPLQATPVRPVDVERGLELKATTHQQQLQHQLQQQKKFHAHAPRTSRLGSGAEAPGVGDIVLHHFNHIPSYLQHNRYIHTGYRVFLSYRLCLRSLLVLHNESVNVWSHLLGGLLFACFALYDLTYLIPTLGSDLLDRLIYLAFICCVEVCMLCSAFYHLFNCHSERTMRKWLQLDFMGISLGLLGGYVPAVYYAFYCLPTHNAVYTT